MTTNVIGLTLCALLLALGISAEAQPKKIPRVGYLSSAGDPKNPGLRVEMFQRGLKELGYVEGKNIQVDYRYIEGKTDQAPKFATELVQGNFDVLVLTSLTALRSAKQATQSVPIVFVIPDNPVDLGLVQSLAHPGGNVTGLTRLTRDLSGKRLELLTEALPGISRVAVPGVIPMPP